MCRNCGCSGLFLALAFLLLAACQDSDRTAVITTRFGIAIPDGMGFDSTVSVMAADSSVDSVICYPDDLGSDGKLRWDVVADEGVSVSLHTEVWSDGIVVATQDLVFSSGDESVRVPDAVLTPGLAPSGPVILYGDLDYVSLWAVALPVSRAVDRIVDSLGWDLNGDGSVDTVTVGDTGILMLSNSLLGDRDTLWVSLMERSGRVALRRLLLESHSGPDSLVDARDGLSYPVRSLGPLQWMAANLAARDSSLAWNQWGCYQQSDSLCAAYGVLYSAFAAVDACPDGWRLPAPAEGRLLLALAGNGAGKALKSTSGWRSGQGEDALGLALLPAGMKPYYRDSLFDSLGVLSGFWLEARSDSLVGFFADDRTDSIRMAWTSPYDWLSLRCVRNRSSED